MKIPQHLLSFSLFLLWSKFLQETSYFTSLSGSLSPCYCSFRDFQQMNTEKGELNQGHRLKPSIVQVAVLRGRKCHHLLVITFQLCTGLPTPHAISMLFLHRKRKENERGYNNHRTASTQQNPSWHKAPLRELLRLFIYFPSSSCCSWRMVFLHYPLLFGSREHPVLFCK